MVLNLSTAPFLSFANQTNNFCPVHSSEYWFSWENGAFIIRSLIFQSRIPQTFVNDAILTACFLLQYRPNQNDKSKTVFEMWYNHPPNCKILHNFGTNCYVTVLSAHQQSRLWERAHRALFLGYDEEKLNA